MSLDLGDKQNLSTLETTNALAPDELQDHPFSLRSLVTALESVNSAPSLEQIYEWLEEAKISTEELQPYSSCLL